MILFSISTGNNRPLKGKVNIIMVEIKTVIELQDVHLAQALWMEGLIGLTGINRLWD